MKLTIDNISADIVAADDAIKHFEETKIKQHKNIAAYHLQQATEKLIKVQIYKHSTQKEIFTHNIDKLITYAETLNAALVIPEYIQKHSPQITSWEAESRYDSDFAIRIDTLKKAYETISAWEITVRKLLR